MKHKLSWLILSNYFKTHHFWHRKRNKKNYKYIGTEHLIMIQWFCPLNTIIHVIVYVYTFLSYITWVTNLIIFIIILDNWLWNFCLCNYDSWKMMSKPRYFSPIPTVSIHFPFLSHTYLPVILSSAFSLSKFRISVRGWQRLSMSSIKKKKTTLPWWRADSGCGEW